MPEYLILYRRHNDSITSSKNAAQRLSAYEIFCRYLETHTISYDEWLALSWRAYNINPILRALKTANIAKKVRQPYRVYLRGDFKYTSRWFNLYKLKAKQHIRKAIDNLRVAYAKMLKNKTMR